MSIAGETAVVAVRAEGMLREAAVVTAEISPNGAVACSIVPGTADGAPGAGPGDCRWPPSSTWVASRGLRPYRRTAARA
jgi:hypothetical protein